MDFKSGLLSIYYRISSIVHGGGGGGGEGWIFSGIAHYIQVIALAFIFLPIWTKDAAASGLSALNSLSAEAKQASPMGLVFHFGYVPPEEYIK